MRINIIKILKTNYTFFIFLVLFIALNLIYGINHKLVLRPQSVHLWRQADGLSITQNYYQRNNPLWEPELYNMMGDHHTSGKSAGEFPGLYYLVAMLWKIFGKSEFLFRFLILLITFLGLYYLFRLNSEFLKNIFQALFISFMLYTSVIFVSYSFNFLTNLPALCFVFIGWFLIWKFYRQKRNKWLWWAMLFFAVGMLLKVSCGISFVALLGWWLIELLRPRQNRILFTQPRIQLAPFLFCILIVLGWYLYGHWYNSVHKAYYTFNDLWPIWKMDKEYYTETIHAFKVLWSHEFFHISVWYITGIMWIFVLSTYKKRSSFLNYLAITLPLGCILYALFWFKAFRGHDYYYIDLYIAFIITWILFFKTINKFKWSRHWLVYLVLSGWFIFNAYNFTVRFKDRYRDWMNGWYTKNMVALGELEPLLRAHEVKPDDFVISSPDGSINASLYLMNQRGFTNYGSDFTNPEIFEDRIEQGAKYLVINDTTLLRNPLIKKYAKNLMLEYKNVRVYDLIHRN